MPKRNKSITHLKIDVKPYDTVFRTDRKTWNKAVELIKNYEPKPERRESSSTSHHLELCSRSGRNARLNAKKFGEPHQLKFIMLEIRQAILRDDWKSVHKLHMCLLKTLDRSIRLISNKLMFVSMFSSPMSDCQLFSDFCRMAGRVEEDELRVFTETMKRLPSEIPRGFVTDGGFKKRDDCGNVEELDAYSKASLPVRESLDNENWEGPRMDEL